MSPESRELESFFQSVRESVPLTGKGAAGEAAIGEFDEFFAKLSNLDDLSWDGASPAPKEGLPRSPTLPDTADDSDIPDTLVAAPPKIEVLHHPAPTTRGPAAARNAMKRKPAPLTRSAHRGMEQRMFTAYKIGLVGLTFFGVGLLAGWLALTLPEEVEQGKPPVYKTAGNSTEATASVTAEEKPASALPMEIAQQRKPAIPVGTTPTFEVAARGEAGPADRPRTAKPASTAARKQAAKPVAPKQGSGKGNYTLQVGACRSAACVTGYRRLLEGHVAAERIRVIAQDSGEISRIRIEPLTRAEARKLKKTLAAVDARFKDAYLISNR